jgi:hypothetical protein
MKGQTMKGTGGGTRTLLFDAHLELAILVHGEQAPSDEDWDAWLQLVQRQLARAERPRCIVVSDGDVVPTPKQRGALNKVLDEYGRPVPTAVMSLSRTARGIVTVMGWFNSAIRAFAMDELSSALEYLDVAPTRRADVLTRIMRMRIALSMEDGSERPQVDLGQIAEQMDGLMNQRLAALRAALKTRT